MKYSYDDIYGIDLDEYCSLQNTTREEIISKIKIDINILKKNLEVNLKADLPYPNNYIVTVISNLIKKKEEHIQRIQAWE